MSIKSTLRKVPVIIFRILKSLIRVVEYQKRANDGFSAEVVSSFHPEMIISSTSGLEVKKLSFYSRIQPKDKIGFIKGIDVVGYVIENDDQIIDIDGNVYEVKEFEVDAAEALYILLLRGVL